MAKEISMQQFQHSVREERHYIRTTLLLDNCRVYARPPGGYVIQAAWVDEDGMQLSPDLRLPARVGDGFAWTGENNNWPEIERCALEAARAAGFIGNATVDVAPGDGSVLQVLVSATLANDTAEMRAERARWLKFWVTEYHMTAFWLERDHIENEEFDHIELLAHIEFLANGAQKAIFNLGGLAAAW
ncbi:MAG: hypothetical protein KGL51_08045 [Betaproteobacteria bacterium]|nr:hypothetical protein [Betaproteobacteria bacterium]